MVCPKSYTLLNSPDSNSTDCDPDKNDYDNYYDDDYVNYTIDKHVLVSGYALLIVNLLVLIVQLIKKIYLKKKTEENIVRETLI